MDETTVTAPAAIDDDSSATSTTETDTELIEDELLVEEISIDGMCGVY
jgi:mycofactocin precursor